jgi:hypothetical protein
MTGVVARGEKLKAVFGEERRRRAAVINQIRPTCGDGHPPVPPPIAPGTDAKIEAEVATADFSDRCRKP